MAFDIDDHPEVGTQIQRWNSIYGISQIKEKYSQKCATKS